MPLIYPFRTAFGNDAVIESVLVRLSSGGKIGWGEASPWATPGYCAEWAAGAFLLLRDVLAPLAVGKIIESGAALQKLLRPVKDNYFAKAAIDLAWWDLHARAQNVPLWQVLGGRGPLASVGADLGVMDTIDQLLAEIQKAFDEGFSRVKLKFRPGWAMEMLQAVRTAFPTQTFHIDCNSAYTLADLEMFKKVDALGLAMIEQPLAHDDLVDHARLQSALTTPLCLDESITTISKTRKAIDLKACRWVNIKLGRTGGLTNALAIHDLCRDHGTPCWVGGMLESAIGQAHSLALATLSNIKYPSDIFPTSRFYSTDLAARDVVMHGPSTINAFDGAGIGIEPDLNRLKSLCVQSAQLR